MSCLIVWLLVFILALDCSRAGATLQKQRENFKPPNNQPHRLFNDDLGRLYYTLGPSKQDRRYATPEIAQELIKKYIAQYPNEYRRPLGVALLISFYSYPPYGFKRSYLESQNTPKETPTLKFENGKVYEVDRWNKPHPLLVDSYGRLYYSNDYPVASGGTYHDIHQATRANGLELCKKYLAKYPDRATRPEVMQRVIDLYYSPHFSEDIQAGQLPEFASSSRSPDTSEYTSRRRIPGSLSHSSSETGRKQGREGAR